jgi:hypothetical protein
LKKQKFYIINARGKYFCSKEKDLTKVGLDSDIWHWSESKYKAYTCETRDLANCIVCRVEGAWRVIE